MPRVCVRVCVCVRVGVCAVGVCSWECGVACSTVSTSEEARGQKATI